MDEAKQQIVERLKQANNVLITVSKNPSVDQLSAAIGFALFLNKLNKHASAVFSGNTPSVLEFLEPEKTLEKNTDSLRDFIISLDKSKADKLRYKVEDDHVKIFITPYRTSISQQDLEFSQGDFNVDVVIAIGVQEQNDLDQAITAHGRILHDATLVSISKTPGANLGTINWLDVKASSLCEMIVELAESLKPNSFDTQMATALLTGIVAETARFSNDKTTSITMSVSSQLLAAGANQQLVAEKLQPKPVAPPPAPVVPQLDVPTESQVPDESDQTEAPDQPEEGELTLPPVQPEEKPADGSLLIDHTNVTTNEEETPEPEEERLGQIHIDDQGELHPIEDSLVLPPTETTIPDQTEGRHLLSEEPVSAPDINATTGQPAGEPVADPLGFITTPIPGAAAVGGFPDPTLDPMPPKPVEDILADDGPQTLTDLEAAVSSAHVQEENLAQTNPFDGGTPVPDLNAAREAVESVASHNQPLPPINALNANPINIGLPGDNPMFDAPAPVMPQEPGMLMPQPRPVVSPLPDLSQSPKPTSDFSFPDHLIQPNNPAIDPNLPPAPPVPPPMMPGMGGVPPLPGFGNNQDQ